MEWLLPWWWERYTEHNSFPVAFADFGLSACGRTFCRNRGTLLSIESPLLGKERIDPLAAQAWEELYGKTLWAARPSWFKKPFALAQTPFEHTLWLDLDCEVLGPLDCLFDIDAEIALARETEGSIDRARGLGLLKEDEMLYNSGVILYKKGAQIIDKWAQAASKRSLEFVGDQQLLSRLFYEEQFTPHELEPIYNWRISGGLHISAVIIHWVGNWGKDFIRLHGGLKGVTVRNDA